MHTHTHTLTGARSIRACNGAVAGTQITVGVGDVATVLSESFDLLTTTVCVCECGVCGVVVCV